jgi:hypothetical protein
MIIDKMPIDDALGQLTDSEYVPKEESQPTEESDEFLLPQDLTEIDIKKKHIDNMSNHICISVSKDSYKIFSQEQEILKCPIYLANGSKPIKKSSISYDNNIVTECPLYLTCLTYDF